MPITELGLLTPKPDAQLRQELDNKLPGALSDQFSGLPKLDFAYIGTILEASGKDASHQNGLCLFLQWQDVTGFDDFVSSPSFLTFKSSMLPFMAGPADLQLFESVEEAFNTGTTRPSYLHVTKLYPKAGISDESQANLKVLESRWDELAEQIQSNSSLVATPLSVALCARGIRKQEGVFLGVTGWGDVESMRLTLKSAGVGQKFQQLQELAGHDNWSSFVFELKNVA